MNEQLFVLSSGSRIPKRSPKRFVAAPATGEMSNDTTGETESVAGAGARVDTLDRFCKHLEQIL